MINSVGSKFDALDANVIKSHYYHYRFEFMLFPFDCFDFDRDS